MGIFDTIKDAIWGSDEPAKRPERPVDPVHDAYLGVDQATTGVTAPVSTAVNDPAMRDVAAGAAQPMSTLGEIRDVQNPTTRITEIDVASQLDVAAGRNGQDLNWRSSIVDLMKVLGLDASLDERRALAAELNYTGDPDDTAAMNMFLHRALMKRLAENGGRVPAEYLD
jgi:hypothetical protein